MVPSRSEAIMRRFLTTTCRTAKITKLRRATTLKYQHIRGFDILVSDASPVQLCQSDCHVMKRTNSPRNI